MGEIITAILAFLFCIAVKLNWDRNQRLDGKKINHKKEVKIFIIPLLLCAIGFAYIKIMGKVYEPRTLLDIECSSKVMYYVFWSYYTLISGVMEIFWFWFLFDGGYGVIIAKKGWWFTGSEDGADDAKSDDFLQKIGLKWHKIIKIGGILIFTSLYILL